jgi:hypothetical protein
MRNILIHQYFGVDYKRVYLVVKNEATKVNVIYGFAALLTVLAVMNNFMYVGLGNRPWFEIITMPIFFVVTYFSLKYFK